MHVACNGVVSCYIVHKHINGTSVLSLIITAEPFTLWIKVSMAESGETVLSKAGRTTRQMLQGEQNGEFIVLLVEGGRDRG